MQTISRELLQTPEQKVAQIERIVKRQPEVAGFQSYEYFENTAARQQHDFIEGTIAYPEMVYAKLNRQNLQQLILDMKEATESLLPGEKDEKIYALFSAIEYRQAELFLVAMSADMNDPHLPEADRQEARQWFEMANEAIYGLPDRDTFAALMYRDVLDFDFSEDAKASVIKAELLGQIGRIDHTEKVLFEPSAEVKDRVQTLVQERFSGLVNHVDPEKIYNFDEILAAVQTALDKLGATELGWQAVPKPDSLMIAVSAHQKLVEVGTKRKELKGADLQMKLIHEVGVHVLRSINAEKAGWLSAAYGQDGYLDFEESLANILGESFSGVFKNQGTKYQVATGLARGYDHRETDGAEPEMRDFREVYEIMWRYQALQEAKDKPLTDKELLDAKIDAFKTCVRIFRGTSGREKGLIYTKDLSYFRGQELAWSELKSVTTQEELDLLLAGKLDITIPEQRAIAEDIVAFHRKKQTA